MATPTHIAKMADLAMRAAGQAYAPYSGFHVGAVLRGGNGKYYSGVNVENASYGGTICAERSSFVSSVSQLGENRTYKELHLLAGDGENFAMPCGLCRQFMNELVPKDFNIRVYNSVGASKNLTMEELLPYAFSKEELA